MLDNSDKFIMILAVLENLVFYVLGGSKMIKLKRKKKTLKDVIVELNEIKFKEYENSLVRSWIDCLWRDKDIL